MAASLATCTRTAERARKASHPSHRPSLGSRVLRHCAALSSLGCMEPETEPGSAVQPEEVHDDPKVRLRDLLEFARLIRAVLDQWPPEQRESALQGEWSTKDIRCYTRTVASASAASSSLAPPTPTGVAPFFTVEPTHCKGCGTPLPPEGAPAGRCGPCHLALSEPYSRGRSRLAEWLREVGNTGAGREVPD